MLTIVVPAQDYFDESKQEFITTKQTTLSLEHSLISLSKWESKWHKPFLGKAGMQEDDKTEEQLVDYVKCMTITQNVPDLVYDSLTRENWEDIKNYISNPMTATWFSGDEKGGQRETITAEIIYYWMVSLNIPFECQKWHLNKLLTLIRVCNAKNDPNKKKMGVNDIYARNRALNEERKKLLGTKG